MGHTYITQVRRLEKALSRFIIATHSPVLMTYPRASVLWFSEEGTRKADFRETDHYNLAKRFSERPEEIAKLLF